MPSTALPRSLGSLSSAPFRRWFIGQSISQVGYWIHVVAQAVLVLDITQSGTLLGLVGAMQFAPVLLVGPWAGVMSDRIDKRRLLLFTQSIMMGTALALGVAVLMGAQSFPIIFAAASVSGTAFAFDQPARRTIVTELVDVDLEANAISLNGVTGTGAKVIGPALGGLLVTAVGTGWCFVLNGLTSIAVLVALWGLDREGLRLLARGPESPLSNRPVSEAFRLAWNDVQVRRTLILLGIVVSCAHNFNVLMPILVTVQFGGSAGKLGVALASMSVGSVIGALWVAGKPPMALSFLGRAATVLATTLLLVPAVPHLVWVSAIGAIAGATLMVLMTSAMVALQMRLDHAARGRVMSLFAMVVLGGHAIGNPVAGWIAESLGAGTAFVSGGIVAAVAGLTVTARDRMAPSADETRSGIRDSSQPPAAPRCPS